MAYGIRIVPETLRSAAFGAIGAAYSAVGSAFAHPIRIIMITNNTDAGVLVSFDGVNNHLALPANGFILLDLTANRTGALNASAFIAEKTIIYVKRQSGAPTTGNFYVSTFYGLGD